ncbi:hypothetical protein P879_00986 [Paragonimus westermani]|uniref:Uncharacterized protein n=1 Tax=Paragonimus westermani TaxID=34504 RepID=A0A8T0DU97_9TREM|nr:hypothetical protein P879_00986 [Paragonimus westermani]
MEEHITSGQAETVPMPEEEEKSRANVGYLPYQPVFKSVDTEHVAVTRNSPTIVSKKHANFRVVSDCAAKYRGVSLNSQLPTGPDWVDNP